VYQVVDILEASNIPSAKLQFYDCFSRVCAIEKAAKAYMMLLTIKELTTNY
jgi:hypothetical protein